MSNTENTVDSIVETPLVGQVEGLDETGAATESAPKEYFAWDEYADKNVKLVVDGEELEVPLSEALSGYQRQADYTRKTQELAEQRRQVQFGSALQEALKKDPRSTVDLLSQHYGLNSQQADEDLEYMDPMEKQYRQLESRVVAFEQERAAMQLEKQIASLSGKYGDLFDADEVVAKALASGNTDLESVYKQVAFDRLYDKTRSTAAAKAQTAEERKIVEAKREAAIVSKGSSSRSADVSSKPITSIREAFESAKRELGG
ncbi:MAG: scaffolding protein [Podoviridae sp. ctDWo9]|nr:MAG: scaffolding protein [Podoviridae sp. ctDWo9]